MPTFTDKMKLRTWSDRFSELLVAVSIRAKAFSIRLVLLFVYLLHKTQRVDAKNCHLTRSVGIILGCSHRLAFCGIFHKSETLVNCVARNFGSAKLRSNPRCVFVMTMQPITSIVQVRHCLARAFLHCTCALQLAMMRFKRRPRKASPWRIS